MENKKVALITGITGQDGSFLAEFLINKGYDVHGVMRRSSSFNTARIEHLYLDEWVRDMKRTRLLNLHWGDMTDSSSLVRIISSVKPTEIYNLAALTTTSPVVLRISKRVRAGFASSAAVHICSSSWQYASRQ